jgi:hypothetical protein
MKDSVTSRRIGIDGNFIEEISPAFLLDPKDVRLSNMANVFFQEFGDAEEGDGFYVAKESLSIRGINTNIGERFIHCVTDSGCSIVAMSEATCNQLGIAFDPNRKIPLQSANGEMDFTLGIAKDVPFRFGEITVFLQAHIVPSPAYDILLGRPFDVLTQATVRNFLSGDQHYTITDPNTHKTITIPTIPRELPRFRLADERVKRM